VNGTVLGKSVNLRVADPDRDTTDAADQIKALVEVFRLKTDEELEAETIARTKEKKPAVDASDEPEIDRWKFVDRIEVTLKEAKVQAVVSERPKAGEAAGQPATEESGVKSQESGEKPVEDTSIHTGV